MKHDEHKARKDYLKHYQALKNKRSSVLAHWKDLSRYILPRRLKENKSDKTTSTSRNNSIYNNTPTKAARTLSSGMMTGLTSPARPWFRLAHPDTDINQRADLQGWLHLVERRMEEVLARSNFYNSLKGVYSDLGVYGTSCMIVDEDEQDTIRAYVLMTGTYCLESSHRGEVDTVYHEVVMTVAGMVEKFGQENVSERVRRQFREGNLYEDVEVLHVIEPNRDYQPGHPLGDNGKPWRSVWLELETDHSAGLLKVGGYEERPFVAPRWDVSPGETYGTSPGMDALPDCKSLMILAKTQSKVAENIADPPMIAPESMRPTGRVTLYPGEVNYVPRGMHGDAVRPAYVVSPGAFEAVGARQLETQARINSAFFADLWLSLSHRPGLSPLTATEVEERHQEKLLQLGPVIERLHDEMLDPLIDRVFEVMLRRGLIPPPPKGVEGQELRVEYVSIMAQAQRMVGVAAQEGYLGAIQMLARMSPEVLDKVDWDRTAEILAESYGIPPDMLAPGEVVDEVRAARAQQQQAAQALEAGTVMAGAAKDLGNASTEGGNALSDLMGSLPQGAAAQGGDAT